MHGVENIRLTTWMTAVPQHVAKLRKLPLFSPEVVMEGGSIEVNGQGALLTTTACLLNKNRNPSLKQKGDRDLFVRFPWRGTDFLVGRWHRR